MGSSDLYMATPGRVAYALHQPLTDELKRLQKQQMIMPLDVGETSEWYNSFVLLPKANGKVKVCLDPARVTKLLIKPVHRGPTLNNILPRLTGVNYFTLIDPNSSYHNFRIRCATLLFNYFFLSIWQVQIHKFTISGSTHQCYV